MKQFSTDLDRESKGWELPDDREATKERVIILMSAFILGIIFGIALFMAYYNITGKTCSAQGYCTIHKAKP